jgi:ABC-type Fe3+-hydroxamate transport system substrate-binding protein
MRILSLLPSATEIVYALGLGDDLVGVGYVHFASWLGAIANKSVMERR